MEKLSPIPQEVIDKHGKSNTPLVGDIYSFDKRGIAEVGIVNSRNYPEGTEVARVLVSRGTEAILKDSWETSSKTAMVRLEAMKGNLNRMSLDPKHTAINRPAESIVPLLESGVYATRIGAFVSTRELRNPQTSDRLKRWRAWREERSTTPKIHEISPDSVTIITLKEPVSTAAD